MSFSFLWQGEAEKKWRFEEGEWGTELGLAKVRQAEAFPSPSCSIRVFASFRFVVIAVVAAASVAFLLLLLLLLFLMLILFAFSVIAAAAFSPVPSWAAPTVVVAAFFVVLVW